MRRFHSMTLCHAIALTLVAGGTGVRAQQQQPAPPRPPVIDTAATSALDRMGEYLRTLKVFRVTGDITTEQVMTDGQKVQHTHDVNLLAVRPNKMRVDITSDLMQRVLLFDGTNFHLYAPVLKYYATIDAPATINELLDVLEDKYALEVPLVDLFRWGTNPAQEAAITAATDVGSSIVNGVTTHHYVFRQPGLDWQVWVQEGDYPLPLKLVITTTSDEARPQHVATYEWDLAPSFNDEAFKLAVPKDAKKIPMVEANQQRPGQKKEGETKK